MKNFLKALSLRLVIIVALSVLTVAGGAIAALSIVNKPSNVMARTVSNFAEDVFAREETSVVKDTLTGGSIDASVESVKCKVYTNGVYEGEWDGFKNCRASAKIYFSKDALMVTDLDAKLWGAYFSGGLYLSCDEIYVEEKSILGGAYGAKIDGLADEFADSIFAYGSKSKYAITDKEIYNYIYDALDSLNGDKEFKKDSEKLLKKVAKEVYKIVVENAEITKENGKSRIDGEKINVRTITVDIDSDAMQKILKDAYDYIADSKDIEKFIDKYDDKLTASIGSEEMSFKKYYNEMMNELEDSVYELCDYIDESFKTISVIITTPRNKSDLIKLTVKKNKSTVFVIDCGKEGIKKTKNITIESDGFKFEYKVKTDDKNRFEANIDIVAGGNKYDIDFTQNKNKKTYSLVYKSKCGKWTAEGRLAQNKDTTAITVDSVSIEVYLSDGRVPSFEFTIKSKFSINRKDSMPSVKGSYKSLSDISEKDIDKLLVEIDEMLNNMYA